MTQPGAPGPPGGGPPGQPPNGRGRPRGQRPAPVSAVGRAVRRGTGAARSRVVVTVGGPARARVIILLACVLALAGADTATVGAAAVELRRALHIGNTGIGLLVTVTSVIGVVFSLPFGVLADRARRTWILAFALVTWGGAMLWSATAASFGQLLLARLGLGAVTAAAGPIVASLIGDWFPSAERGRIYGYVLTGELLGAGIGFAGTGTIAALSWRAAFIILALPAFVLAVLIFRMPEPARGGKDALAPDPDFQATARYALNEDSTAAQRDPPSPHALAAAQGVRPNIALARQAKRRMTFPEAVRYVLKVKTNVALIISSACGYYFLAGVQTFGAEFTGGEYHVNQVFANLLLLAVGAAAVGGVLAAGPISDALLRRGHLTARITTAAVAATITVALFIPALVTHSALTALPYIMFAGAALAAQNPPIDAARQDIMPPWLWGRAEAIRTSLRTAAQAVAPLLFGAAAQYVFGGGTSGLRWTFVVMLLPLAASAVFLYRARRLYPTDVATTTAITSRASRPHPAQPAQPRRPTESQPPPAPSGP